jgi:hypothetical protein
LALAKRQRGDEIAGRGTAGGGIGETGAAVLGADGSDGARGGWDTDKWDLQE